MMYRFTIIVACLASMSWANACSPIQAIDILFSKNSSHVSPEQLLKLAGFMIRIDAIFPNHEILVVNGTASVLEKNSGKLAAARARQVAAYLQRTKYRGKFEIGSAHVWKLSELHYTATQGRAAEILFIPALPHACSKAP